MPKETRIKPAGYIDPVEVAKRLLSWRGDRTQFELAKSTNSTPQSISQYENQEIPRNWEFLAGLAIDGCDLNWLLTGRPRNGGPS